MIRASSLLERGHCSSRVRENVKQAQDSDQLQGLHNKFGGIDQFERAAPVAERIVVHIRCLVVERRSPIIW
jgi:hypothetical protein